MDQKPGYSPWSSLGEMMGRTPSWLPPDERERVQSYDKYDQMYWNDPSQYAIRVLDEEQPIYVPNARVVVNTTAQYLMRGLAIVPESEGGQEKENTTPGLRKLSSSSNLNLSNFLKRERFFSKFNTNKLAGITRGDCAFHITADPAKPEGSRLSIDTLHPGMVIKDFDPDDPTDVVAMSIVEAIEYDVSLGMEPPVAAVRRLKYTKDRSGPSQRILREELVFLQSLEGKEWWEYEEEFGQLDEGWILETVLAEEYLPDPITQFPIYWVNNVEWESQLYGSSELRGLEFLNWAASQGATDTQMALALEGLGVYATDGGRPVDDSGKEVSWEIVPGGVMEVPSGSYFRRVEGVGSITPMMDQLKYLEGKLFAASGMTDVALGQVDVAVAQSGVALAIKFMPTLARIETRDTVYLEILQQMFYDLQSWFSTYDPSHAIPAVDIYISESKLPVNRVETVNELNNMYDRGMISKRYYRQKMVELGHVIPADEDEQIKKEKEEAAKLAALTAPPGLVDNAIAAAQGDKPITNATGGNNDQETVDKSSNNSNNRDRTNESSGTESSGSVSK